MFTGLVPGIYIAKYTKIGSQGDFTELEEDGVREEEEEEEVTSFRR